MPGLNNLLLNTIRTEVTLISPSSFMRCLNRAANACLQPAIVLWGGRSVTVISDEEIPIEISLQSRSTEPKIFVICKLILLLVPGIMLRLITLLNRDVRRGFTCIPIQSENDLNEKDSMSFGKTPLVNHTEVSSQIIKIEEVSEEEDPLLVNHTKKETSPQIIEVVVEDDLNKKDNAPLVDDIKTQGISRPCSFIPEECFNLSGKPYFKFLLSLENSPSPTLRDSAIALRTNSHNIIHLYNDFPKTREGALYAAEIERFLRRHYEQCINIEWDIVSQSNSPEIETYIMEYMLIMKCAVRKIGFKPSEEDERVFLKQLLLDLIQSRSINQIKRTIQRDLQKFKAISLVYAEILAAETVFSSMISTFGPQPMTPQISESQMKLNKEIYREIVKKLKDWNLTEYLCPEAGFMKLKFEEMQQMLSGNKVFIERMLNEMRTRAGEDEDLKKFIESKGGFKINELTVDGIIKGLSDVKKSAVVIPQELFTLSGKEYFADLSDEKSGDLSLKHFRELFLSADGLIKLSGDPSFFELFTYHLVQCRCALYDLYTQELPLETMKLYSKYLSAIAEANKKEDFQKFMKSFDDHTAKLLEKEYDNFYSQESLPEIKKEDRDDLTLVCKAVSIALHLFRNHFSENPESIKKRQKVMEEVLGKGIVFDDQIRKKNDELLSSDSLLNEVFGETKSNKDLDDKLLDDVLEEVFN